MDSFCGGSSFSDLESTPWNITFLFLIPVVCLIGAIGNIFCIIILSKDNFANTILTIVLAVADLTYLLVNFCIFMIIALKYLGLEPRELQIVFNVIFEPPIISILSQRITGVVIMILAAERLFAVYKPLSIRAVLTKKVQRMIVIGFCLTTFLLHIPLIIYGVVVCDGSSIMNNTLVSNTTTNDESATLSPGNLRGQRTDILIVMDNNKTITSCNSTEPRPLRESNSTTLGPDGPNSRIFINLTEINGTMNILWNSNDQIVSSNRSEVWHNCSEISNKISEQINIFMEQNLSQTEANDSLNVLNNKSSTYTQRREFKIDAFKLYFIILSFVSGVIPVAIIVLLNVALAVGLYYRRKTRLLLGHQSIENARKEMKATVTLFVVIVIYTLSVLPTLLYFVLSRSGLAKKVDPGIFRSFLIFTVFLCCINSSVNFIIYYFRAQRFREIFKKMFNIDDE